LSTSRAQLNGGLSEHWRLGHSISQMPGVSQAPSLVAADDEIYSMLLAGGDRLVKVTFAIGYINPLACTGRTTGLLKGRRPAL
jgi:hypothetical protein